MSDSAAPEIPFLPRLFLEDFVVTQLLVSGRPLKAGELSAKAEGFSPSRRGLHQFLDYSERVAFTDRDWDLKTRLARQGLSREERSRQPVEGMLQEILSAIGKPLPLPVIAREISLMRNEYDPEARARVANVLRGARFVVEIAPDTFLHRDFVLETGARTEELLLRENQLKNDPDFAVLSEKAAPEGNTGAERALAILKSAGKPLKAKTLAFLVRRAAPEGFNAREFAVILNDRKLFQPLLDGFVASQEQLPNLRAHLNQILADFGGGQGDVDIPALLRQRVSPDQTIAPTASDLEELKKTARASNGQPIDLAPLLLDVWEMEPTDPNFVPTLQGFNEALRRDTAFMPVGIGRFLLRESVPDYLGTVPKELRPVLLELRDPVSRETLDFEMSDDGLEGDCADFVHNSAWEDVGEELEVRMGRKTGEEAPKTLHMTVLNHHFRTGTLKLRRQDEAFWELQGGMARLGLRTENGPVVGWASKESGLIYGLGDWMKANIPPSGGLLEFSKVGGTFSLAALAPDKITLITPEEMTFLEELRESAQYLSLFEILQRVMTDAQNVEIPAIWARVNVVRRTSKRVLASVLCGYSCFYFKQKGPKQLLWRFDEGKVEQGFKKNKRKFVRR